MVCSTSDIRCRRTRPHCAPCQTHEAVSCQRRDLAARRDFKSVRWVVALSPVYRYRSMKTDNRTSILFHSAVFATCQAPSLSRTVLLTLCYMSIEAPPTVPSLVGRQYGLLTSASFCDIKPGMESCSILAGIICKRRRFSTPPAAGKQV